MTHEPIPKYSVTQFPYRGLIGSPINLPWDCFPKQFPFWNIQFSTIFNLIKQVSIFKIKLKSIDQKLSEGEFEIKPKNRDLFLEIFFCRFYLGQFWENCFFWNVCIESIWKVNEIHNRLSGIRRGCGKLCGIIFAGYSILQSHYSGYDLDVLVN